MRNPDLEWFDRDNWRTVDDTSDIATDRDDLYSWDDHGHNPSDKDHHNQNTTPTHHCLLQRMRYTRDQGKHPRQILLHLF